MGDGPSVGVPLIDEQHKMMLGRISDVCEAVRSFKGATAGPADSINTLLGHWLVDHNTAVDQEFGDFLRERRITIDEIA